MNDDLCNLKHWMRENRISSTQLARDLKVSYSLVGKIRMGIRTLGDSFKYRFGEAYGFGLAHELFSPESTKNQPKAFIAKSSEPDRYLAQSAVARAIRRGTLLPAKHYLCVGACGKYAAGWHHPSYIPDDHLNVVPLCRKCHSRADRGLLDIDLGIVALPIGIVRIAIAGAPT